MMNYIIKSFLILLRILPDGSCPVYLTSYSPNKVNIFYERVTKASIGVHLFLLVLFPSSFSSFLQFRDLSQPDVLSWSV